MAAESTDGPGQTPPANPAMWRGALTQAARGLEVHHPRSRKSFLDAGLHRQSNHDGNREATDGPEAESGAKLACAAIEREGDADGHNGEHPEQDRCPAALEPGQAEPSPARTTSAVNQAAAAARLGLTARSPMSIAVQCAVALRTRTEGQWPSPGLRHQCLRPRPGIRQAPVRVAAKGRAWCRPPRREPRMASLCT